MGKFKNKSGKTPGSYYTSVAAGLFILFFTGCLVLILNLRQRNKDNSFTYLQDLTIQRQMSLSYKMDSDFQTLRGIAAGISSLKIKESEKVYEYLTKAFEGNEFSLVGFVDLDKEVWAVNENGRADIKWEKGFEEYGRYIFNREMLVPASDKLLEDEDILLISVPVENGSRAIGAIWAANSLARIDKMLEAPLMEGEGYFLICDDKGNIIAPGVSPLNEEGGGNLFDYLSGTESVNKQISRTLRTARTDSFNVLINGKKHIATFQALGENNWSVVSIIEKSIIDRRYNTAIFIAGALFATACVIALVLFFWYRRSVTNLQLVLEKAAYTDSLTGIRNYRKFLIDAERIIKDNPEERFAVWSFDTINFNRINTIFGNETGDKVLKRIANVLGEESPPESIHCRVSGDLFAGLRPYKAREELEHWFWHLIKTFARREVIADHQMRIDDVMGIYCVDDFLESHDVNTMVNRASLARRRAKEKNRDNVMFFSPEMERKQRWLAKLEAEGKKAVKNGEITFFLQPKVLLTGETYVMEGAEALARWKHPEHGWIFPGDFIPLFENNGFIVDIDRYVFEKVCQWYKDFSAREPQKKLCISINVSRQGLLRDDFIKHYSEVKNSYAIPDNVLELEFTESIILEDLDIFQSSIDALHENGFRCSLDDFGAGYSSLNTLKELSIDVLKLDSRFLKDSNDIRRERIVVSNFIKMTNELGVKIVAEGVESREQVSFLKKSGCDMVQGYIFSKPLTIDDFEEEVGKNGCTFEL